MGLKKEVPIAKERQIRELPRSWFDSRLRDGAVAELHTQAADLVMAWVGVYACEKEEIEILLKEMFSHVLQLGQTSGKAIGRQQEKETNPALKAFGEVIAAARRADRAAMRATLAAVFDAESARGNAYAAFAQAMKAIAD